ncbi:MAG: hypothetical protein HZC48_13765 [Nitrospirae bacterium]|nr:hypothetical protein [Nitrospirota bacterium]
MNKTKIVALILYVIAVICAYLLRTKMRNDSYKAIKDKKLSIGIYRIFPVEGEQAVKLAKGYINVANIVFWFTVCFFPFIFFLHWKDMN